MHISGFIIQHILLLFKEYIYLTYIILNKYTFVQLYEPLLYCIQLRTVFY